MTQWTRPQILAKLDTFKQFLTARGAQVLESTNEYELLRFIAGNTTCIVYTKNNGNITFYGDPCEKAWIAFKTNGSWRAAPATRRNRNNPVISTLRKRDGDLCFYCLKPVSNEDETEEHLLSITHGGPDNIQNKCLAHKVCNNLASHMALADKIKIHTKACIAKAIADYRKMQI